MTTPYTFYDLFIELFACYILHGLLYLIIPFIISKTSWQITNGIRRLIIWLNAIVLFFFLVYIHYAYSTIMPSWIATVIWSLYANKILKTAPNAS